MKKVIKIISSIVVALFFVFLLKFCYDMYLFAEGERELVVREIEKCENSFDDFSFRGIVCQKCKVNKYFCLIINMTSHDTIPSVFYDFYCRSICKLENDSTIQVFVDKELYQNVEVGANVKKEKKEKMSFY